MSSPVEKKRQQKKRTKRKQAKYTARQAVRKEREAEQQLLMQDPERFLLQKGLR